MLSPTRAALFVAIGAMAIVASEANAGCKYISGTYVCAAWIKGSTDCVVTSEDGTKMTDAECIITGVNEFGYYEDPTYCASGELPKAECIVAEEFSPSATTSAGFSKAAAKKKFKKHKKEKDCKPWHGGKHDGKHVGHNDSCSGLSGDEYLFAEMTKPRCTQTSPGVFDCSASGTISLPQEGGVCEINDSSGTYGNSAAKMLAIAFACVQDGEGGTVCNYDDPIIDYCTLNEDGNYDCDDISGQEPSPLDPSCQYSGGD